MSNDLISRSELSKGISNKECKIPQFETEKELNAFLLGLNAKQIAVTECLSGMATAYDVDKVVERLKQIKTDNSCKNCTYREKCDELQEFYNPSDEVDLCALVAKELSIQIVKYGDIE